MGQVLIRNLDDAVIETLKKHAERANQSLEQSLRDLLNKAAQDKDKEDFLAFADRIRARSKPVTIDATILIREDRDNDHGRQWPGT